MSDDYWDRRRELNDYHDRQYDRRQLESDWARRTEDVYDGLIHGDHGKTRRALDLPPEGGGYSRTSWDSEPEPELPPAHLQWAASVGRLKGTLLVPSGIPEAVAARWRQRLEIPSPIPVLVPPDEDYVPRIDAALFAVNQIRAEVGIAEVTHKPSLFDVSRGMAFMREMEEVKRELTFMQQLLEYARNYLQEL